MYVVLAPVFRLALQRAHVAKEHFLNGQTISSSDGLTQVTVPGGWSPAQGLHPKAQLQASSPAAEEFLLVLSEYKKDYPGMTLERYAALASGNMAHKLSSAERSGPTALQVNARPALQYRISGIFRGERNIDMALVYLVTAVEDDSRFYQIVVYTRTSRFEEAKDGLQKIIGTFQTKSGGTQANTSSSGIVGLAQNEPSSPSRTAHNPALTRASGVSNNSTNPKDPIRTRLMGTGSDEFIEMVPDGAVLIGFEVGLGKFVKNPVVHSIRPIYNTAQGETNGTQQGGFDNGQVVVKAKPGYAVAGLTIKAGLGIDGLSVKFMRLDGQTLNSADSYISDWIGGKGGGRETLIGGNGSPIVGIFGKFNREHVVTGLGLMLDQLSEPNGTSPNEIMVKPTGVYAAIDTRLANDTIRALKQSNAELRSELIQSITGHPENYAPPVFYLVSAILFKEDKKDDAAFWFYAGQLRGRIDANICADKSARQAIDILNQEFGTPINQYAFRYMAKLAKTIENVLRWEETTEYKYDRRWINLHGIHAFPFKADTITALSAPQEEWENIRKKTRDEYRSSFYDAMRMLDKKKP